MNIIEISILVVLSVYVLYVFWKIYTTKKFEGLLEKKQETSGVIELRRTPFKREMSYVSGLVILLVAVLNVDSFGFNKVTDTEQSNIFVLEDVISKELPELVDQTNRGVYIVTVNSTATIDDYSESMGEVEYVNYSYYDSIETELNVYEGNVLSTNVAASVILTTNTHDMVVENFTVVIDAEFNVIENTSYLVIGGYVDEDTANGLDDERLNIGAFLYPWTVIVIEGYDPNKSYELQSEEVKILIDGLIEEYYD